MKKNFLLKSIAGASLISILPIYSLVSANSTDINNANYLANKGIIVNKSNNPSEYKVNNNILRQEVAVVALGIHGGTVSDYCQNIFADVSATTPNTWACKTIEALERYDVISDDNYYFRPEAKITKAEALGMLIEAGLDNEYDYDSYNYYTKGNWQKQVVDFAVSKGLVNSFTDYNSYATRGFIFTVGANILKYKSGEKSNNTTSNQDNSIFNVNNLEKYSKNTQTTTNNNLKNTNYNTTKQQTGTITQNQAKSIALKAAGLSENQTTGMIIKNDYEYGKLYYEVDFYKSGTYTKYDYKIDSTTGQIVEYDVDYNDYD